MCIFFSLQSAASAEGEDEEEKDLAMHTCLFIPHRGEKRTDCEESSISKWLLFTMVD